MAPHLLWHDEASHEAYLITRERVTKRIFAEIDGFIGDSFRPESITTAQVAKEIDELLGYSKKTDVFKTSTFRVDLTSGNYLIVGIELWAGGEAISEDAISLRAYKAVGNRFVFIAEASDLHSSDPNNNFLASLEAIVVASPVKGEFWLMCWAEVPPRTPPTVTMRIYAFNGSTFRTVWAPQDIIAQGVKKAVEATPDGGIIVNRMAEPHASSVIKEQYGLTAAGPVKIASWKIDRRDAK